MRFNSTLIACILLTGSLGTGCGLFGSKKESNRILQTQNTIGCLNGLGKQVGRYFKGTIDAAEWEGIFTCVEDQLVFFKKYVHGNAPDGYNEADIGSLIRNFLITEKPISNEFISGIFEIKSSFFGGPTRVIAPKQIDQLIDMVRVLRRESLMALPYIRARVEDPTKENLQAQADAVALFGKNVSDYVQTRAGTHSVSLATLTPFGEELMLLLDLDPKIVRKYQDFIFSLKAIVAGGSAQQIESFAWANLIREGAAFGGLYLAYRDFDETHSVGANVKLEFYLALAERATLYMDQVLSNHSGSISMDLLNPAIDSLPLKGLSPEKRSALKASLPKVLKRTLRGKVLGQLDIGSIQVMLDVFRQGVHGQTHLEKIYENISETPTLPEFESEALRYLEKTESGEKQLQVKELIEVAKTFVGLYPVDSNVMVFSDEVRGLRTKNHMIRMQWYGIMSDYILSTYAENKTDRLGTVTDLQNLTDDFIEILSAWKLANPLLTSQEMAIKRFREANLFTPVSNGDKYMSPTETTYYFAYLFSTAKLASKTYKTIVKTWKACPILGVDEMGEPAMEAQCFRDYYFRNYEVFWAGFPDLVASYRRMSPAKKLTLQRSMEMAARTKGYSQELLGLYDINSFAALPHYVENVVERFDVNGDQFLSKKEILILAYPVFKQTLIAVSGRKQDWLLQAALTYAIKFKKLPRTKKEQLHFLTWASWRPFWKVSADRGSLYQVLAILSDPKSLPPVPASSTASIE